tara:strand:+ start:488 stop:874 length:387 start_codon:yes stop_codon:yes gene_type:complete
MNKQVSKESYLNLQLYNILEDLYIQLDIDNIHLIKKRINTINLKHIFNNVGLDLLNKNNYSVKIHKQNFEVILQSQFKFEVNEDIRRLLFKDYYSKIESLNKRILYEEDYLIKHKKIKILEKNEKKNI